ncbi:hypothetical protein ACF0H5_024195 [Mactra antiquata]
MVSTGALDFDSTHQFVTMVSTGALGFYPTQQFVRMVSTGALGFYPTQEFDMMVSTGALGFYPTLAVCQDVTCAGPICFHCQRIPEARYCNHVTRCGEHEICYVEQFVSSSGTLFYDVGCRDNLLCKSKRSIDDSTNTVQEETGDIVTCSSCCHGNHCNTGGCGSQPMIDISSGIRGPICMNCPLGQKQPEYCDIVTVCNRDQSCYLHPKDDFTGVRLYTSGCTSSCTTDSVLIGKRVITSCTGCCRTDFCNMNCTAVSALNTQQTTTLKPSNTLVTTTSTLTKTPSLTTTSTTTSPTSSTTPRPRQIDYERVCSLLNYNYLSNFDHCYKIYSGIKLTWNEARTRCQHDHGDLFILHNKDEETLFESLTETPTDTWDTKRYWIGATDQDKEGHWVWLDGTRILQRYFYPTEPNNGPSSTPENCGALSYINKTFLLNDDVCSNSYHFICEINLKEHLKFTQDSGSTFCRNTDYTYERNNGFCYKVYDNIPSTMIDARKHCLDEDADLLQLKNVDIENVFINTGTLNHNNRYWLGVTRDTDGLFYWLNGQDLSHGHYLWANGQPDNYHNQENCVDLANVGTFALNDDNCAKTNHFICQERCPNTGFSFLPTLNLCIKVYTQDVTWTQAKQECHNQNSELIEPNNMDKLIFLDWFLGSFNKDKYWVGARLDTINANMVWQSNGRVLPQELLSAKPTFNMADTCMVIGQDATTSQYSLQSENCNTPHTGYICQYIM